MAASQRYYCRIGGAVADVGEIKFGFVAPEYAYKKINDELGVTYIKNKDSAKGVLFGANYPKPPKVRISADGNEESSRGKRRTALRFCDTDKVGRVLNGSLNDTVITINDKTYKIVGVSI